MTAKMFPQLKLLCWLFMGPTFGFDTKQRNSFLINFGVFYNKNKILTILFIMRKPHFNGEFLVLLGPIISRFFCMFKWGKKPKQQRVLALVLSLWLKDVKLSLRVSKQMRCHDTHRNEAKNNHTEQNNNKLW
jgi:hypothetical protein